MSYRLITMALLVGLASGQANADESGFWTRDTFTGDWGGARSRLSSSGVDFSLRYTGEVFGNLSGGRQRGTTYEDLFSFAVDADLQRLMGWTGGSAHVSVDQIDDSGNNIADLVGSISDPSNIDARPTTRLFTLWVQQKLGDVGSLKLGQIIAGKEFMSSKTAADLIDSTFGWANILDVNLPGGGPAYPLATPGARLALNPTNDISVLAAVFSGNPAGNCPAGENPEACNKHGTTFSFTGGALFMGEVQYQQNQAVDVSGPRSTYKLGGWYHTGDFADQGLGHVTNGQIVSLAVNSSDSLEHRGNWGVYGVVDRLVWQNSASSVTVFWRGSVAPANRNLLSWYMDGGVGLTGPLRGRPDDTLTFGIAYSNISSDAAKLDRVTRSIAGSQNLIRDGETVFELNYTAQLTPWWKLQPDLQYFVHPGGGVADPDDPRHAIKNAFIIGLRTTVDF